MNLEILHGAVGPFRSGDVVPASAVAGGFAECERLCQIGAARWCEAAPTVEPPAAMSAVMEMGDDELVAENKRLRQMLGQAAKADDKIQEVLADVAKLIAAGDAMEKKLDECVGHLTTLASGTMNLQVLRDIPDGPKAGEVVSPTAVAANLHELLDSGAVGWTEKQPASPAPGEKAPEQTTEPAVVVNGGPHTDDAVKAGDATPEKPAKKGKK